MDRGRFSQPGPAPPAKSATCHTLERGPVFRWCLGTQPHTPRTSRATPADTPTTEGSSPDAETPREGARRHRWSRQGVQGGSGRCCPGWGVLDTLADVPRCLGLSPRTYRCVPQDSRAQLDCSPSCGIAVTVPSQTPAHMGTGEGVIWTTHGTGHTYPCG